MGRFRMRGFCKVQMGPSMERPVMGEITGPRTILATASLIAGRWDSVRLQKRSLTLARPGRPSLFWGTAWRGRSGTIQVTTPNGTLNSNVTFQVLPWGNLKCREPETLGPNSERVFDFGELQVRLSHSTVEIRRTHKLALVSVAALAPNEALRCNKKLWAFKNASDVESQESCIHPSLSDTARAGAFLRCSRSLSRQK